MKPNMTFGEAMDDIERLEKRVKEQDADIESLRNHIRFLERDRRRLG